MNRMLPGFKTDASGRQLGACFPPCRKPVASTADLPRSHENRSTLVRRAMQEIDPFVCRPLTPHAGCPPRVLIDFFFLNINDDFGLAADVRSAVRSRGGVVGLLSLKGPGVAWARERAG